MGSRRCVSRLLSSQILFYIALWGSFCCTGLRVAAQSSSLLDQAYSFFPVSWYLWNPVDMLQSLLISICSSVYCNFPGHLKVTCCFLQTINDASSPEETDVLQVTVTEWFGCLYTLCLNLELSLSWWNCRHSGQNAPNGTMFVYMHIDSVLFSRHLCKRKNELDLLDSRSLLLFQMSQKWTI